MRRKAILGALLLISVGVVLGATVFRTDIAQATGLAQSVTVDNTDANPVPVQQVGTPVTIHRRPKWDEPATYTVPSDKRLVIQYVNGFVLWSGPPLSAPECTIVATYEFNFEAKFVPNTSGRYNCSEQVTIYAGPGETITFEAPLNPGDNTYLTLSGYLIPG